MDNGIVQVTLSNPDGIVTGIRYNGVDNLLEVLNKETNRGYVPLAMSNCELLSLSHVCGCARAHVHRVVILLKM